MTFSLEWRMEQLSKRKSSLVAELTAICSLSEFNFLKRVLPSDNEADREAVPPLEWLCREMLR